MIICFDEKSFFPMNHKDLIRKLLRFTELGNANFDEEMNVSIRKLVDFLLLSDPFLWVNFTGIDTVDINQALNQAPRLLESSTDDKISLLSTLVSCPTQTDQAIRQERIMKRSCSIRGLFPNKQIIFFKEDNHGANILYILAAFTKLLLHQACWIHNLVLIQVCPFRMLSKELENVSELVRQVNQLYGNTEFVPVHFYHQDIDEDELLSFMGAANFSLCLNEPPHQPNHPFLGMSVFVKDPSNITQLANIIHNALVKSISSSNIE